MLTKPQGCQNWLAELHLELVNLDREKNNKVIDPGAGTGVGEWDGAEWWTQGKAAGGR